MEENVNFDNEVLAYLTVRKDQLIDSHKHYIGSHPEIREVLNDFLSSVLLHKPNDVFVFAKEYFHPFNPTPLKYKPLIVVGPSGVGKGTLINEILKKYGGLFEKKISYTTRARKSFEKTENSYHFITKEEFLRRIERNEFVEQCNVHGNYYGTTYAELERIKAKGKIPIIEVDVKGAIKINEKAIEGNFLFLYPPSFEELRRRLGTRTETEEEFKLRIQNAIKEIELANNSVLFTNRLVNDDLDQAIDQFYTLIEALYFQELKNLKEQEQQVQHLGENLNIQNVSSNQKSSGGSHGKPLNVVSNSNGNFSSTKKSSQQLFAYENSAEYQQQLLNQQRLQSLMSGNDLQPLEEEISKEDDDSIIIKVDIQKNSSQRQSNQQSQGIQVLENSLPSSGNNDGRASNSRHRKKSSNKSNPYFPPQQNSARGSSMNCEAQDKNLKQQNSTSSETLKRGSQESTQHQSNQNLNSNIYASQVCSTQSLAKAGSLKTCSSIISGDFNYNSQMEEALLFDLIKLSDEENNPAPKIFDPQFGQSYDQKLQNSSKGVQGVSSSQYPSNGNQSSAFLVKSSIGDNQNVSSFGQQKKSVDVNYSQSNPTTQDNTLTQTMSSIRGQNISQSQTQVPILNQKQQNFQQEMGQQQALDYNQQQKEKARQIIEQLKAQQQQQKLPISQAGKVEKRLFDYQKKLEEKIDHQRRLKEQQELQQLRSVPQISDKSNEILLRKSMMIGGGQTMSIPNSNNTSSQNPSQVYSPKQSSSPGRTQTQPPLSNFMFPLNSDRAHNQSQISGSHAFANNFLFQNYQVEQRAYYEELKRKEEQRLKIIEEKEMQGFTGKPQINKKSQSIKRKVDDLIEWREVQEKKRQEEQQKRTQQEQDQIQQMQSQRNVNKQSEKMIEKRYQGQRSSERAEDRLMREALLKQKKKERNQHSLNSKQVFYISDLEPKQKKKNNGEQSHSKRQDNVPRARSRSQNTKERIGNINESPRGNKQNQRMERSMQHNCTNEKLRGYQSKNYHQQELNQDLQIFSQSARIPIQNTFNPYQNQNSPKSLYNLSQGPNQNTVESKALHSPFGQSNKSAFSTNLNILQTSNLVNPQSDCSQLNYYQAMQLPQNATQPFNYIPQIQSNSFQNQYAPYSTMNSLTQNSQIIQNQMQDGSSLPNSNYINPQQVNPFSPQRFYTQQILQQPQNQSQDQKFGNIPSTFYNSSMGFQPITMAQQFQNPSTNSQQIIISQTDGFNMNLHNQQQLQLGQKFPQMGQPLQMYNLFASKGPEYQNNNNSSSKIQMISQLNNISNTDQSQQQTPTNGSFKTENLGQNGLALSTGGNNLKKFAQTIQNQRKLDDKHAASVKPYNLKNSEKSQNNQSQANLNQQNRSKKALGYVSLFEKVQRMNTSQNSDLDSTNSLQSMPVVSAQQPVLNNLALLSSYPSNGYCANSTADKNADILAAQTGQSRNSTDQIFGSSQNSNNCNQQNLATHGHGSIPNISSINQYDQSNTLSTYQGMITQNDVLMTPLPDVIHSQYWQYAVNAPHQINSQIAHYQQYVPNSVQQQQFINYGIQQIQGPNTQDQIINKILDNSFIPSGNVNQARRLSNKGNQGGMGATFNESHGNNIEGGTTFALSQYTLDCLQPLGMTSSTRSNRFGGPQFATEDYHNIFNEQEDLLYSQAKESKFKFTPPHIGTEDKTNIEAYEDMISKSHNPHLQIIDNDFLGPAISRQNCGSALGIGQPNFMNGGSSLGLGNKSSKNRLTNENGQMLDTEFVFTNSSICQDSVMTHTLTNQIGRNFNTDPNFDIKEQVIYKSLNQAGTFDQRKSSSSLTKRNNHVNSRKSSQSPREVNVKLIRDSLQGNNTSASSGEMNPQSSTSQLKNLNFLDRNNQWLENKKNKIERKRQEIEIQQERECPFRPLMQTQDDNSKSRSHTRGVSTVSQEKLVKIQCAGKSLSLSKKRNSSEDNENRADQKIPNNKVLIEDLQSYQASDSNYTTARNDKKQFTQVQSTMNSAQKENYYSVEHPQTAARQTSFSGDARDQKINVVEFGSAESKVNMGEFDISGQCDITNLSPDPFMRGKQDRDAIDDSNFDTSFLSSQNHGQIENRNIPTQSSRGISQVKVMSKRIINF